jgi:hypothetical protein
VLGEGDAGIGHRPTKGDAHGLPMACLVVLRAPHNARRLCWGKVARMARATGVASTTHTRLRGLAHLAMALAPQPPCLPFTKSTHIFSPLAFSVR